MTVPTTLFKLKWVTVVFSVSTSLGLAVGGAGLIAGCSTLCAVQHPVSVSAG